MTNSSITQFRKRLGKTRKGFANFLGLSLSLTNALENGKRQITFGTVERIAERLGCTRAEVTAAVDDPSRWGALVDAAVAQRKLSMVEEEDLI